jgi:hypothetical protein
MKELILFLSDMKDRDIGICSVRQGFDTSTSMGEIMFQFVGILSSWEREMIREKTLASLERARREGKTLKFILFFAVAIISSSFWKTSVLDETAHWSVFNLKASRLRYYNVANLTILVSINPYSSEYRLFLEYPVI